MKEDITYRTFVRFGKLGLLKQKGYGINTFHAPPAPKGFYAMPIHFQEYFLISGIDQTQSDQLNIPNMEKFRKPDGEIDWDEFSKKEKERYSAVRHEFIIKKDTEFWHHLDVPNNVVLARHNDWVKTSYHAWKKAVDKENIRLRAYSGGEKGVNSTKKRAANFTRDHFEVFFDSKVV